MRSYVFGPHNRYFQLLNASAAATAVFVLFAASARARIVPADLHTPYLSSALCGSTAGSAVFQRHYRYHFIIVVTAVVSDAAVPAHFNVELRESEAILIRLKFKSAIRLVLRTGSAMNKRLNCIVHAHVIVYGLVEFVYFQCRNVRVAAKGLLYKLPDFLM